MDTDRSSKYLLSLTEREQEVLALIAAGLSNHAIAERLVLSHHTVAWYVKQIFSKLDVTRRTQAVAVARSLGLLDEPTPAGDSPKSDSRYRMRHNLPPQPTSFIGREAEIAEITALIDDANCRLLTLVGPGGIGKTRLAIEVATRKLDKFANGVCFIALQPLASHEDIVPTIASSLGLQLLPDGRALQQQLFDYLREKAVLFLMDNFEHLLDSVQVVSGLLAAAPGARVLVTSRESLNLREEHLYNVGGLKFPSHEPITSAEAFSAVALFAERACRVCPDFSLIDELPDLVRICQLVDGMPLALELAASWLKTLSCKEITAEIEQGPDILATPLRNVPERHRSMQAVFDHSWRLLREEERAVFRRLSVFRGGCTWEAAQAVAGADLRVLQGLVDKSFIRRDPHSGRYDIHELLRHMANFIWAVAEGSQSTTYTAYYAAFLVSAGKMSAITDSENDGELELNGQYPRVGWAVDHRVDAIQKALHTFAYFHVFRSRFLEEP
jgi:predicted ATPase/DNA-binding CsgD family transcriptional regulator